MDKVFSKRSVLFGLLLVAFIIVFEIILAQLNLPPWPAFMVMVFFFVVHEDVRQVPNILIGGLFGIVCIVLSGEFIDLFGPFMGTEAAKLTFIGLFVYSIVLFKDAIPYVFNSYSFMFFLVSAIAKKGPDPSPYIWMAVELVVGAVFIAGILGINRVVDIILGKKESVPDAY
ncbi:MAG TPA: DUF1097 family protein [Deltaproteobacteria bacterium]|nr:DUF1097 family protein [Deltaproteobacteria bacterium]HPR55356.1 DUF1097 family protein [Deltaproteobacteria bacterium]HXK48535.1 DUF1097 family protein [Deltaproteobacteria bacterium]